MTIEMAIIYIIGACICFFCGAWYARNRLDSYYKDGIKLLEDATKLHVEAIEMRQTAKQKLEEAINKLNKAEELAKILEDKK